MTRLDDALAYTERHRLPVCALAGFLIAAIACADWILPNTSVGFLYLLPVLLAAPALRTWEIAAVAVLCGYLREAFDPLQAIGRNGVAAPFVLSPLVWVPGSWGRLLVATAGFAMTGLFVAELNHRRRLLAEHLRERERQMGLLEEAEQRVRILIETSPLAILTLDAAGKVRLANESAARLLGFDEGGLQGRPIEPYLPLLPRMLSRYHSSGNMRTNVECRGQRLSGEVFLAHVWLSTFRASDGLGLAAVVWDASENLRDREGAGLDSMMATSRVLIGAISHEIRNLAAAACSQWAALPGVAGGIASESEPYRALGALIEALEKIATSGLRMASDREAVATDLGTVLDEARIVVEPALREDGALVHWEIPGALPLVQADHQGLLQVFVNLARNSQRAIQNATRKEIRLSVARERDLVVVRFRDTGCGVAHPEELFKPFQRGAHSAGIGLYVSRAILRAHGGELLYEPPDEGTCFAVELWPVESSKEG